MMQMSVAFPLVCAALMYVFLALVGRAVVNLLCRQYVNRRELHALAPAVGLSVLTLLTTYLVKAGIPLAKVAPVMTLVLALASAIVLYRGRNIHQGESQVARPLAAVCLAAFLITAIAIAVPFVIGGYQFTILRGNGSDAFNYATMADVLARYPLDWVLSHPHDQLAGYSPSLPWAWYLLQTRWSTAALLAFASSATGIAPIQFEYGFMLALALVLFSSLVAALSATGTLTKFTVWLPVAFVGGFWGQYVLDISALSQIAALPIVTVLLAWMLSPPKGSSHFFRYGAVVTAILFAGVFFEYPEILIAYFAGMAFLFLVRSLIAHRSASSSAAFARPVLVFLASTLILTAPLLLFVVNFAHGQASFATAKTLGWEDAYFSWMRQPIMGVWGGGATLNEGSITDIYATLAYVVGLILTIAVFVRVIIVVRNYRGLNDLFPEIAALLLAASGAAGYLVLVALGNPWSAGKVMSFFVVLIPIVLALWVVQPVRHTDGSTRKVSVAKVLTVPVIGWVAMNAIFAGARISHTLDGTDFGTYIAHHGEYRRVNAGEIAQTPIPDCARNAKVAVFDISDWGREYRTDIVEGYGFSVATPPYNEVRSEVQASDKVRLGFDCVFADRNYFDAPDVSRNTTGDQVFIKLHDQTFVALAGMVGGYGLELDPSTGRRFVFTGNQEVQMTVVGRASKYNLTLKVCAVALRPQNEPISVYLDAGGTRLDEFQVTDCVTKTESVTGDTNGFTQHLRITSNDSRKGPTLIGADPRNLRLRVEVLSVRIS
jgi:hypothetical protein